MSTPAEHLALRIIARLQSAGHVAYLAGGCVRDRVMGRTPKDFDVATSARPEQVLALFPRGQQVGAAFGVILVIERPPHAPGDQRLQVEVATFRTDGTYSDGRHPDSVEFTTAQQDARRRDFTCNGLFFDPLANGGQGQLHDFVGGQADIAQRLLRAIGDPEARFREDHLRMLRAVRFAARLDFTLDPATRRAIIKNAPNIRAISRERIGEELGAILEHPTRAAARAMLLELGLMPHIWPWPIAQSAWNCLPHLPPQTRRPLALAALALDFGLDVNLATTPAIADSLQSALALSNDQRDEIAWLLDKRPNLGQPVLWSRSTLKRLLADPRWPQLFALNAATHGGGVSPHLNTWIEQMRKEGVAPTPFVTGDTLIGLGAQPGPRFKKWLEELYDRQLEGHFRTAEEALEAARRLVQP